MNLTAPPLTSTVASNSAPLESYLSLGASLYIPTSRVDLGHCIRGPALQHARSVILCTEDAINEAELSDALDHLRALLSLPLNRKRVFVRPRSPDIMEEILAMCGSEQLAGFVLPKIDLYTLPKYEALINQRPHLRVMLTIETKLAFRRLELER